ncbi:hypothetical protein AZSI13_15860 [Azospira sp. I13]|uniref:prepilin-type N-terminal cleavage/methylation domain-containing protein n=1 Tax=Azospira sp. I13 TaxID=1765050 RepID=UPI000D4D5B05|nr:prepilin-type N-terminal cleavage/methylation domain-containing protein [Azospira sp. I13]GBG02259.1 hypothetical protein AZSI13_15860 [Azospira sp. I13]
MSSKALPRRAPRHDGFTLIEVLIVLLLSLGIIATITQIYRATGKTLQSLKGPQKEWYLMQSLRGQTAALLLPPNMPDLILRGDGSQLFLPTWKSRANGNDGKPVLVRYTIDSANRRITYQETPLPAWWYTQGTLAATLQLAQNMQASADLTLLGGIEDARFSYLAKAEEFNSSGAWLNNWSSPTPPQLIKLSFNRSGRDYDFWLETQNLAN